MDTSLVLTADQAEKIVRNHLAGHAQTTVRQLTEITNTSYSYTAKMRTYILDLQLPNDPHSRTYSCFLSISSPTPAKGDAYHPNSLPVVNHILNHIRTHTEIPIPSSYLDTSLNLVPYWFLLSPASPMSSADIMPLSALRKSGMLNPQDLALIELQIGKFLGQLHSGVENDWFGLPSLDEPVVPSYSWQETFTSILEFLLSEVQNRGLQLPYEEIRTYLSRAIGFSIFDDVDVPSLVWFTGSEDDIYISLPSHPATKTRSIAAILPNLAHAFWGDPLFESFFLPPGPSDAILEGYLASGGRPTMQLPRQKTKRLWYSLFLGLILLRERNHADIGVDDNWALHLINKTIEQLKDAPCY